MPPEILEEFPQILSKSKIIHLSKTIHTFTFTKISFFFINTRSFYISVSDETIFILLQLRIQTYQ